MAIHAFETSGYEAIAAVPTTVELSPETEQFVAARGWSCSKERQGQRPLTSREQQILTLIVDGKTPKEVAYDLEIAHSTVRVIYSRAMKKLGGIWQPAGRRPG
jgi:DNA-binding NarL/FixJ family response regulator